ncbi:unnamed protein product, partial [Aureobasidium mustum]
FESASFTYSGPGGWTYIGPGGLTTQSIAAATNENEQKKIGSTDNSAIKSTTKRKKKYYCCYGHGQNNTHSSKQCFRRKKAAANVYRPDNSYERILRQEVPASAQEKFVAVKAKDIKKEIDDDQVSNENVMARYSKAELKGVFDNVLAHFSNAELKEISGEVKKEMERRGIDEDASIGVYRDQSSGPWCVLQ